MKFKIVSSKNANSFILGHTIKLKNGILKKGKVINTNDIILLAENNVNKIYVAIKEKDDYSENYSAKKIAEHISSKNLFEPIISNGRADLFSNKDGMLNINRKSLIKINSSFSGIAVSSLKNYTIVKKGQLIGNVKVFPYAIGKKVVNKILNNASFKKILEISKREIDKIGVIFTTNDRKNLSNEKILNAINKRLHNFQTKVNYTNFCNHHHSDLSETIKKMFKYNLQLILIYGETSIADFNDVVPRGIKDINGKILSYILPTDPGNLLLIGKIDNTVIIGVPGCAKSIKRNGFDDILERVCHGDQINKKKLAELSEGGLYKNLIRKFE